MKNSILLLSCIFESTVSIHMHIWFQKIMKCITHLCMHTFQNQNLWLWPKRPPSAFFKAETSVAEMSRPKRPRPKCPWPKCPSTPTDYLMRCVKYCAWNANLGEQSDQGLLYYASISEILLLSCLSVLLSILLSITHTLYAGYLINYKIW